MFCPTLLLLITTATPLTLTVTGKKGDQCNGCGGGTPPPQAGSKYWLDTHPDGNGRSTPGDTITGTLYKGTSYVYYKAWAKCTNWQ